MALDLLQLLGAVLLLTGFVLSQRGLMRPEGYPYILLNLAGSAILAAVALHDRRWGFLLLEATWALVSLWALAGRRLGRDVAGEP